MEANSILLYEDYENAVNQWEELAIIVLPYENALREGKEYLGTIPTEKEINTFRNLQFQITEWENKHSFV